MNSKRIRIDDYVTVPFRESTMRCPINNTMLTDDDLKRIMMRQERPLHIYAINLNDSNEKVLLTRDNYMKSNDELFGVKPVDTVEHTTKTETFTINVGMDTIKSTPKVEEEISEPAEPINEVVETSTEDVKVAEESDTEEITDTVNIEESTNTVTESTEVVEEVNEVKTDDAKSEVNTTKRPNNSYNGYVRQNKKKR